MISMLPLVAGDSWIGVVVFLVIMVISAISQATGKKKEAQPRPKPRPRPPVRPAQAGPGRQNPAAGELEDFLRRAAGGRQQPPPAPIGRPVVAQPVMAEVTDELEVIESVAEHMNHSAGESRFGPQGGSGPEQEDAVSRKFDRQAGQVGSSSTQAAHQAALAEPETSAHEIVESMPPTAAAGLGAMLASPTSLRQAILLKEILDRPESRWS